jgi:flagellar biosynthesis GTPase FlhF
LKLPLEMIIIDSSEDEIIPTFTSQLQPDAVFIISSEDEAEILYPIQKQQLPVVVIDSDDENIQFSSRVSTQPRVQRTIHHQFNNTDFNSDSDSDDFLETLGIKKTTVQTSSQITMRSDLPSSQASLADKTQNLNIQKNAEKKKQKEERERLKRIEKEEKERLKRLEKEMRERKRSENQAEKQKAKMIKKTFAACNVSILYQI